MALVLIVDDNPESLYLLRCILSAEGLGVVETRDGRQALEAAAAHSFDLVISDILMPVMDGFGLCRAWKADPRLRCVPFVFFTATYTDPRDEVFARSLGADLFLVKPAEPASLLAHVRALLTQKSEETRSVHFQAPADTPFLQQYNEVLIHKLEDKLVELEQVNRALLIKEFALASSANGILIANVAGDVSYANPALLRMASKSLQQVQGMPLALLFAAPEAIKEWLVSSSGSHDWQLPEAPDSTRPVWVHVEKHSITDPDGQVVGLMLSCADISEERRLRHELARAQRLESLSLFAAGVAHDFNNLLMAIFSGLELDLSPPLGATEREDNRALALAAFQRARDLTHRLLNFSTHGGSERRPVDLRQLLDECLLLSLSGSGIRCEKHYCTAPALAIVDAGQVAQVFSNLVVNARQAMNDRGVLLVLVSRVATPPSGDRRPVESVKVSVIDDGPGIPDAVLPHIFEPYFTTKSDGTGLGLATSQAIIQEHGGRISALSSQGTGATFEVALPAVPTDTPVAQSLPVARVPGAQAGRLLVMDDQESIRALLQKGLERAGYSVVVVASGEQVLREFREARAGGRRFDLFLLDVTVRGGMGGIDTLAELRKLDPDVLVIAMTGYAEEALALELREQGFLRVIPKPFLLHELFATLQAVLPTS